MLVLAGAVSGAGPKLDDSVRLFEQGRFAEAEKALTDVLGKAPQAMAARLLLGWVLWSEERYDEALVRFKSVLADAPARRIATPDERMAFRLPVDVIYIDNPDLSQARKGLGWTYLKKRWTRLAHEQFSTLNRRFGDWDEPYLGLGYTWLAEGKLREAEGAFMTYLEKTGAGSRKPEQGLRGLGAVAVARGDFARAIGQYEKVLSLRPGWTEMESELAWTYIRANEPARAERVFVGMRRARPIETEVGLAWAALRAGRIDAADEGFARALAASPGYAPAIDGQRALRQPLDEAWALYDAGRYRDAASAFSALLKNAARLPLRMKPLATNGLAWARLALGEVDEAERLFRVSLQDLPDGADATAGLGWVAVKRARWSDAEKMLGAAGRTQPGLRSVTNGWAALRAARFGPYDRAWALYNESKFADALKAFEAIVERPADLPPEYFPLVRGGIGWCELGLGRVERAEATFKQIKVGRAEDEAEQKAGLGWVALKRRQPEQASRLFAEASKAVPRHVGVTRGLAELRKMVAPSLDHGWAAYNRGKVDEAAARFRETTEIPGLPTELAREARRGLAWTLYTRGLFQESLSAFEALLKDGEDADLVYGRGLSLLRLGRAPAAVAPLKRASGLVPESVDYQLAHGWALLRSGETGEALRTFLAASRLAPLSGEVSRSLAWAYTRLNRTADAKAAFRNAANLVPGLTDDQEFRELTAFSEWAELRRDLAWGYVRWQSFEAARALFETMTKADPGDGDAWFGEGYALYKLGQQRAAQGRLERAIKAKRPGGLRTVWVVFPEAGAYPIFVDPRSILGWTALVDGRCDLAIERFNGSLARDPEMVASMVGKALCLTKSARPAEARQLYELAREVYPTYPAVLAGLKATDPAAIRR